MPVLNSGWYSGRGTPISRILKSDFRLINLKNSYNCHLFGCLWLIYLDKEHSYPSLAFIFDKILNYWFIKIRS